MNLRENSELTYSTLTSIYVTTLHVVASNVNMYITWRGGGRGLKLLRHFLSSLRPIQVEQFWAYYCHLARPCELPSHCDIHLFKLGIKPMWEDDANKNGGKWMVRLKKGIASRCWENLVGGVVEIFQTLGVENN